MIEPMRERFTRVLKGHIAIASAGMTLLKGDLAGIVRKHKRARLVAAGHVHRATMTSFAGIAATICPAPNHAVALDLDGRLPPSLTVEPPAFHLHVWLASDEEFGIIATHLVPIGDFAGPFPFFGADGRLL